MQTAPTDIFWSRRGKDLLKSGVFADACVYVGDSSFRCHKIVLASAGEFFEKLFAYEGLKTGELTLTETTPHVFKIFLDYIYTLNEEPLSKLTFNELLSLLESVHMWMAFGVEKISEKMILERLDRFRMKPQVLIRTFELAYLLDKKSIMDKVIHIINHNKIDCPEIYNLEIDCFTEYFMRTNWLNEIKRFDMAEKWVLKNISPIRGSFYSINWNPTNCKPVYLSDKVSRIFQTINFEKMSLHEFYNGPGKSKLLADSRKVEIIYKIACKFCQPYRNNLVLFDPNL